MSLITEHPAKAALIADKAAITSVMTALIIAYLMTLCNFP